MQSDKSKLKINKIRHSLSHLLAMAVLKKYPGTKLGIGPIIENGFYYDFDFGADKRRHNTDSHGQFKINDADLPEIEKQIRELIKQDLGFKKETLSPAEAKKIFAKNPYKTELIKELQKNKKSIRVYTTSSPRLSTSGPRESAFVDLCAGPHIKNTSEINPEAFKLTKIAGAYWRGSEKNPMLTRIYGVAFETKKELGDYLKMMEEAEKRDHRKLGERLNLFVFSDLVGKGLPLWTEKGATIRRELEKFIVEEEIKRGYKHVYTPDLARLELYKKSGHYPYYKDSMYSPIKIENEEFMLRPMSCPHHFELFLSKPRSWRELPMRIAELAKLYRFEKSGELTGLLRARSFCLADAHIICADENQAKKEINGALDLIEYAAKIFGLEIGKNYWYQLSLGDRKDSKKYYKDDKVWNTAEKNLKALLKDRKSDFIEAKGEAAFYGPKIDIQMKNVFGKEDTAFTVQYDFVMPKRFNLRYINKNGKEQETIVVHRSSIGAIERSIAFLLEHFAGALPLWLSPVQAIILPVSEKQNAYAKKIFEELQKENIRTQMPDSDETLGKRIREAEIQKIPYILVIGDKEIQNNSVNVRHYRRGQEGEIAAEKLIEKIKKEIEIKSI